MASKGKEIRKHIANTIARVYSRRRGFCSHIITLQLRLKIILIHQSRSYTNIYRTEDFPIP